MGTKTKTNDVPNARFWEAEIHETEDVPTRFFVECERWNDARDFARRVAGGREVVLRPLVPSHAPRRRWQVRWAGSPMSPHDPPYLEARKRGEASFRPLREIDFR